MWAQLLRAKRRELCKGIAVANHTKLAQNSPRPSLDKKKKLSPPLRAPLRAQGVLRAPPCPSVDKSKGLWRLAAGFLDKKRRCSPNCRRPLWVPSLRPLWAPSWTKRSKDVLRAPPWPSVDKKKLRCSPCPSVALRGQKEVKVFSVALVRALRGQKEVKVFSVVLRGPSWTKRS